MAKKILLADDSVTIQKVVSITLAHEDFDLTIVDNGTKAVAKTKEIKPDVILLDVVMPDKDGYQVCQEIKAMEDTRSTPIILLTGTFEPFDADRAAEVGADDFIKKPFESHTLINKVKEMAARSGTPRQKPVDISEVDIDFETPVESEFGEPPAQTKTPADETPLEVESVDTWEEEVVEEEVSPAGEQESEDIWSVEEFEEIAGAKTGTKPPVREIEPSEAPRVRTEGAVPVQRPVQEAAPPPKAVSDDFFVQEEKTGELEVEDFELGEEISEDELEKYLEEEDTGDDITVVENGEPGESIIAPETEEEVFVSERDTRSKGPEAEMLGEFEEDLLVEDFEESPREAVGREEEPQDFFLEEETIEEPVNLEWEEEPRDQRGKAPAVEKTAHEFETLIRRTVEDELADFTKTTDRAPDKGGRPAQSEMEVDLGSFDEGPLDEEVGTESSESDLFDLNDFSDEAPIERTIAREPSSGEAMSTSLEQKDISQAVDKIAREVIQKVVWEVVPELAEELIKQEIKRLKGEKA